MTTQKSSGFTIIEVILFLAISGALVATILIGSNSAIGQQRYRDSVLTFKGLLQEQYGLVANTINIDAQNPACSKAGDTVAFAEDATLGRGTSDCLLMGRFIFIEPTTVTVHSVVGEPAPNSSVQSDAAALQSYGFGLQFPDERTIGWGARVASPGSTDGITASILIIRSPLSGSILTYVRDGDYRTNIKGLVGDGNMAQKDFCIDPDGLPNAGNRLAVRLNARASGPSAVEIPLEADGVCD